MTVHPGQIDRERLLRLSEDVGRIARSLAELSAALGVPPSPMNTGAEKETSDLTHEAVVRIIRGRRDRARYLTPELFSEPAWDILLELLRAELAYERVPVSNLCTASAAPATTALRYIKFMVEAGVIFRRDDAQDGRRVFIELTPEASSALRRYFADVVRPCRSGC
jgi:DNA-binding MarR family transcriptional regulator